MLGSIRHRFGMLGFMAASLACSVDALALDVGEVITPAVLAQLTEHQDKTIVVDFFAEWCQSCRKELPLIASLKSRTDAGKVVFVGVDTDDSLDVANAFQQEMKDKGALNFPVVNDIDQTLVGHFKPKGFPALYIIHNGKLVSAHLGATPAIDAVIEKELAHIEQQ